jgi:hypothetical protein
MPNHRHFTTLFITVLCVIACTPEKSFVIAEAGQLSRFYNTDSTLYGFKNQMGEIIVDTVFSEGKNSVKIVSAKEVFNDKYYFYHVTREGKIVAKDSYYFLDMDIDCESEGHIRFWDRNRKTESRTGLLNGIGKVVIPAIYNDIEPCTNGLVNCLEGATYKIIEGEIYRYVGGHHVLRDTLGTILIKNFEPKKGTPYFYNLKITDAPDSDPLRESFKTTKGNYYSFLILEKEMERWFFNHFCTAASMEDLKKLCFKEIVFNGNPEPITPNCLSGKQFREIKESILTAKVKPRISIWGIPPFGRVSDKIFYDHCGNYKKSTYPIVEVSYDARAEFHFIYTAGGFKFTEVNFY